MGNPIIHIAYAEDHAIVRKGVISFLHSMDGMIVNIEAENGKELISKLEKATEIPDVCILDIDMPEMNGFDTIIEVKKKWPEVGVLILTVFDREMYIIRMVMSGANGYLLKKCDPNELKKAIVSIHHNGMYYSDIVTQNYFHSIQNKLIKLPNITAMEMRVLTECCGDLSYEEIGIRIGKTTRSVEGYRDSLFKKLKINSRVSLAMFAVQFGLVPIEIDSTVGKSFSRKNLKKYQ